MPLVLLETTDGRHELLRTDGELGDNWYGLGVDGVVRALQPTRQHWPKRKALQRVRTAIRGQRTVLALCGRTT